MIRTQIHLTKKQREELRQLSEADGLPVAEHIRRAIDRYLEELKKERTDN